MDNKTILIVSGGPEAVPGIRRAALMGLHVVVSDMNPAAPGFAIAHDRLLASTYDVHATLDAARVYHRERRPIDGVISMAADVPLTVATVADDLGLPGIPIETARLASDKLAMKQRFEEKGIAIPWYSAVDSQQHLLELTGSHPFPLVLKPVDSRGARGVLKLSPDIDLRWAYNYSRSHSPSGRTILEEFLSGQQISSESILLRNADSTPGFTDRNYEFINRFTPYIIENGGDQPSVLSEKKQREVSDLTVQAGRALGIETGIVKGDMVYTDAGAKVIEVATRLSGGWFSSDQIPLATGVDIVAAAIRIALGEPPHLAEIEPKYWKGVAIRYFFTQPGRINAIRNTEKFDGCPWIKRLMFFVKPGDELPPVTDHTKRAGCIITIGDSKDEAVARAREVVDTIIIETTTM